MELTLKTALINAVVVGSGGFLGGAGGDDGHQVVAVAQPIKPAAIGEADDLGEEIAVEVSGRDALDGQVVDLAGVARHLLRQLEVPVEDVDVAIPAVVQEKHKLDLAAGGGETGARRGGGITWAGPVKYIDTFRGAEEGARLAAHEAAMRE